MPRPPQRTNGLQYPWSRDQVMLLVLEIIPGLDHHCTWLNTCISRNNYDTFLLLVSSNVFGMVIRTLIATGNALPFLYVPLHSPEPRETYLVDTGNKIMWFPLLLVSVVFMFSR
ncbi:hypothetical protein TrRE_jg6109 [Triparma retinervis]|uniref:Palmitoyltransferase n=1 Tax=Triparma retinervis TaxID=2557542 RepID=A0A9W6ZBU9_9STRA|nr:hypothetical protein TrRE_jg6109 [Triparma retinervis]